MLLGGAKVSLTYGIHSCWTTATLFCFYQQFLLYFIYSDTWMETVGGYNSEKCSRKWYQNLCLLFIFDAMTHFKFWTFKHIVHKASVYFLKKSFCIWFIYFPRKHNVFICDRMIKSYEIAEPKKVTHLNQFEFIKKRFKGIGKDSTIFTWLVRNAFHMLSDIIVLPPFLNCCHYSLGQQI
jgi:hypothetical protein